MTWAWRTTPDGFVEVDRGTGSGFEVLVLPGEDQLTKQTETWLELAQRHAQRTGVPVSWILATIYSESGGNPHAGDKIGGGLMALTLSIYHLTRAQAEDPEINVKLGADTLAANKARGCGLPEVASMFNGGPAKTGCAQSNATDVWGYVETRNMVPWTGYIEKVVRASNWWNARLRGLAPPLSVSSRSPVGLALAFGAAAVGGWYLVSRMVPTSSR